MPKTSLPSSVQRQVIALMDKLDEEVADPETKVASWNKSASRCCRTKVLEKLAGGYINWLWPHGTDFACAQCMKTGESCIFIDEHENVVLLPQLRMKS